MCPSMKDVIDNIINFTNHEMEEFKNSRREILRSFVKYTDKKLTPKSKNEAFLLSLELDHFFSYRRNTVQQYKSSD